MNAFATRNKGLILRDACAHISTAACGMQDISGLITIKNAISVNDFFTSGIFT